MGEETIGELIRSKMARREALVQELKALEAELIDAGAVLSMTIKSAGFLRNRGRLVNGDSCRAQILALLSDGKPWQVRDVVIRIPCKHESTRAQLSRMTIEGDLVRVRHGVVQLQSAPVAS